MHHHFGNAEGGDQAQLGRAATRPGGECNAAGGKILASTAQILTFLQSCRNTHLLAFAAGELLHDDGVSAVGDGRAGHDADRLASADGVREGVAGEGGADQRQRGLSVAGQIRCAHGVAVHGRIVVGRHVAGGDHVAGQHAIECSAHRHAFPALDG